MEKLQDNNGLCFKKSLRDGAPVLGIDYGEARIGVALSDVRRVIASPWKTVAHLKDFAPLIGEVSQAFATKRKKSAPDTAIPPRFNLPLHPRY